jgi:hypothetical protein
MSPGAGRAEFGRRLCHVRHCAGDVVHALTPPLQEPPDRGVGRAARAAARMTSRTRWRASPPGPPLGVGLLAHHGEPEDGHLPLDGGTKRAAGDTYMIDLKEQLGIVTYKAMQKARGPPWVAVTQ